MKKIACIGSITTDIIVSPADNIPTAGTLRAVERVEMHVGGCASNAAIDLARLGVPSALFCRVGSDSFGEYIKSTCERNGVDVGGIVVRDGDVTTGSVVCVNSSGERSFLYNPGSTASFCTSDINSAALQSCDIVFVAGALLLTAFDGKPCADFLCEMKKLGKFTVMDTAWDFSDRWLSAIEDALPQLDLFMPSYDEAVKLTDETDPSKIADKLFDLGCKTVIIKLGKDGALVCEDREKRCALPTYSEIKPVDTTGAGDSFCAGFLAGLSQGWDYEASGRFANAVGTHCVMAVGASTGIKPIAEILKFMEENEL